MLCAAAHAVARRVFSLRLSKYARPTYPLPASTVHRLKGKRKYRLYRVANHLSGEAVAGI
jgi:hypothetical protein